MNYLLPLADVTTTSGFLGSFLTKGLKTNQLEVNTDEKTLRPIARLKEPRELFALPKEKDYDCAQQAPRWPIECQVVEERIEHIPNVPETPEPYYQPNGNELKPRPVGEENGIVVYNYNPISAVNYDKCKKSSKKFKNLDDDSSDSDASSCDSRGSSPEIHTKPEASKSISKLLPTLEAESSSNSNDDDDSDENDDDTPKGYRLNFLGNENNGDIEDIWANKSPEYVAATPTYIKSQFGKKVKKSKAKPQEGVMDCKGLHVVSPIKLDEKLASQLNMNLVRSSSSSLSTNSDEPTEDGEVDADEDHMYQTEEVTAAATLLISQVPETSFNAMLGSSEINIKTEASLNPNPNSDRTCPAPNTDPLATTISGSVSLTSASPAPMPQPNLSSADNSWSSQEQNNAPSTNNYNNSTQDNQGNAQQSNKTFYPPQFSRSAVSGSKIITNCHPYNPDEYDGLEFESRFESGNLAKAIQITPTYYELYLRPDLYTSRSKQWFYFRVRRTKKNMIYRFSIVNLVKSNSLYNDGMRPLMYSTTDAKTIGVGWKRCGDNICYYCNEDENQPCSDDELDNNSYTLTFNVEFSHDNDVVYFSHSYPYTYSDLQDYLMAMQKDPLKSKFCKLRLLCRTLAGNNVYYLTITAPTSSEEVNRRKKSIVISARVHPSETPSSWMMKGLMDFITADTAVAKRLRHKFIFKLIPMLNPDGVIVGNTRNSLTGKDLNRQYRTVIRETYPSIWYTKALIKRLIDESGVSMYCDMHAHSRCHNIFIYGCENKRNPEKKLTEQVFPLMLHKNASDKFSFENCKFKIQRSKEGTGRIVVWMLGITNSYTLEASFGGSTLGSRKGTHFNIVDYEQIGRAFCETLLDYSDENPAKQCLRLKIIERLLKEGSSAEDPINIPLSDYSSDEGSCSSSDEGKTNNSFSDLEGPCCLPIKAPPCSPDLKLDMTKISEQQRIFRYSRMRKIMQELDRIYFQPLFHKKARFLMKNKRPSAKPRQKRKGKKSDENRNQKGSKPNTPRNKGCQNKELKPDNNDKVKMKSLSFGDNLNNQNGPKNAQMAVTLRSVKNCEINSNEVIVKEPQTLIENQEITANETVSKKRLKGGREVHLAKHKPHVKISRKLRLWLAKRQIIIIRRRTPRKIKLQWKAIRILNYHNKKDERQILDIPTTDPGSDLVFSTDDEFVIDNNNSGNPNYNTLPRIRRNLLQSDLQRRYIEEIGDGFQRMPPELIITSPINSLAIKYKVKPPIKVQKIFQLPTVSETTRRTLSWHNLHTEQRHSPKSKNNNSPQIHLLEAKREALRKEDLNIQLSLKKKIWAGIQPEGILNAIDRTKPLMRLTSSAKTEQQNPKHTSKKSDDIAGSGQQLNITTNGPQDKDHTRRTDVFLRTCSRKLVQWQLTNSGNVPINILEEKKIPLDAAVPEIDESQTMRIFRHIVNNKKAQKTANKIKTESHGNERKSKIKRNSSTKNFERMKNLHKPTKSKSHTSLISMALETKNSSPHIRASSSGNLKRNLLQMTALSTVNKNLAVRSKKSKKTKTQSTASRKINEVLPTTTKTTIKGLPSTTYDYAQHNSNFVKTVNSNTLMRKIKTKLKKKKLPILNCSNHLQLTGSSTAITA